MLLFSAAIPESSVAATAWLTVNQVLDAAQPIRQIEKVLHFQFHVEFRPQQQQQNPTTHYDPKIPPQTTNKYNSHGDAPQLHLLTTLATRMSFSYF